MAVSDADVKAWFDANPNASDKDIAEAAKAAGVSSDQISRVTGESKANVEKRASTVGVNLGSSAGSPSKKTPSKKTPPAPTTVTLNNPLTGGTAEVPSGGYTIPQISSPDFSGLAPLANLDLSGLGSSTTSNNNVTIGGGGRNVTLDPSKNIPVSTIPIGETLTDPVTGKTFTYGAPMQTDYNPERDAAYRRAQDAWSPTGQVSGDTIAPPQAPNLQNDAAPPVSYSNEDVAAFITNIYESGGNDLDVWNAMQKYNVDAQQVADATGTTKEFVQGALGLVFAGKPGVAGVPVGADEGTDQGAAPTGELQNVVTGGGAGTDTGTGSGGAPPFVPTSAYGRYTGEDTARIQQALAQLTGMAAGTAALPDTQKVTSAQITESPDEIVADPTTLGQVTTTTGQVGDPTQVGSPTSFDAATYTAAQAGELDSIDFTAGKLSTDTEGQANALVANIQGEVSRQSLVEAAQGTVSPQATVKYQMEELMQSVEEGEPFPPWAAPAARAVGAIMQQRGLGSSSMASAALMQAVVESGIPIAAQDAQTYAQIDLQNLNNRQQAALQNAATYAAMDRANLDARMQAAITNAQSFLAIDLQNLTNEQRSRELEYQSNVQRMFNNQAADNAALQFNAQNENQVDMFFAELATQVETSNANRSAAAEQFNVSQSNAMEQFTASLNNARDQFNTSMAFQVNQSNAEWRRQINTVNTAADNNANLQNAQNAFAASQNAIAQLWQEYRDELAWINTSAENAQARAHEITLYALQQANVLEQLDEQVENSVWTRIGERIVDRVIPVQGSNER